MNKAIEQNKIIVEDQVWHRTGDSGFLKNGELFLTGRCQQLIVQKGEIRSPFIIENKLQSIEGIINGTMVKIKDQLILAIQSKLPLEKLELLFSQIQYDKICKVSQMPLDPRHHTKIDYSVLNKMLLENRSI